MEKELKAGDYAWCWYFKIPSRYDEGLELYYCKILKLGYHDETCEIYYGEELDITKIKGVFKDVCVSDIKPLDHSVAISPLQKEFMKGKSHVRCPDFSVNQIVGWDSDLSLLFTYINGAKCFLDGPDYVPMTTEDYKTIEHLIKPRYEVKALYPAHPKCPHRIGEIINVTSKHGDIIYPDTLGPRYSDYPAIFRKLAWWEHRKPEEMPKYVFSKNYDTNEIIIIPHALWKGDRFDSLENYFPATENEFLTQLTLVK